MAVIVAAILAFALTQYKAIRQSCNQLTSQDDRQRRETYHNVVRHLSHAPFSPKLFQVDPEQDTNSLASAIITCVSKVSLAQKLDHKQRCVMERTAKLVEGQFDVQKKGRQDRKVNSVLWSCQGHVGQINGSGSLAKREQDGSITTVKKWLWSSPSTRS